MAPRTTADQWQKTHQTIIKVAQHQFATKGYNGTSMNDIVKESRISKGAIYNHFESKEHLFQEILRQETELSLDQLIHLINDSNSVIEKLKKALHFTYGTSVSCPREICMMQIEFMITASRIETINPNLKQQYQTIHRFFMELIEEGKRTGEIKDDVDASAIVTLVYATLDGLAFQHATLGLQYDPENIEKVLMEMVLNQIAA
jgi:AcrR family transcriptional regulator